MIRILLAVALIALSTPALAGNAPVRAIYEVYFGGLHILTAESEFTPDPDTYAVTARARTRGVLDVFFDWRGETRSAGRFDGDRAIPGRHTNFGWRGDRQRSVILEYGPDGQVLSTSIDPAPDPEEVTAMPEGSEAGTVDPLSVIAELSHAVARSGSCSGEFAVYDGRRRYDLRVTDLGTEALPATDYSIFSGEAMRCSVEYAMLGGQRKERSKYAETARERVVYVARPIEAGPAIPVALKIETDFGTLVAHITEIEAPGERALRSASNGRGSR